MENSLACRARAMRGALLPRLAALLSLSRQRRGLSALSDHRLADLGISRDAAEEESRRPFWDVPRHWRR